MKLKLIEYVVFDRMIESRWERSKKERQSDICILMISFPITIWTRLTSYPKLQMASNNLHCIRTNGAWRKCSRIVIFLVGPTRNNFAYAIPTRNDRDLRFDRGNNYEEVFPPFYKREKKGGFHGLNTQNSQKGKRELRTVLETCSS